MNQPHDTVAELDAARTQLVLHRLDPAARCCSACGADCPCKPAQEAAEVLARAGAWNTVPFLSPAGPPAPDEGQMARRSDHWLARVGRRLRHGLAR